MRGAHALSPTECVLVLADWAYNFEDGFSTTGNAFMNLMQVRPHSVTSTHTPHSLTLAVRLQGYGAITPVMPAAGNHEACEVCLGVPELPDSTANFTQYRARLHSVSLFAGANAGTNSNVYYSFNEGQTHFLVFSAEAYAYKSGAQFIANQLAFMKGDLAAVDRSVTPWVVALVHKDWTMEAEAYADFAPILENGGVDLLFCG